MADAALSGLTVVLTGKLERPHPLSEAKVNSKASVPKSQAFPRKRHLVVAGADAGKQTPKATRTWYRSSR